VVEDGFPRGESKVYGHQNRQIREVAVRIEEVPVERTYAVRREVLRGGREDADVRFPTDDRGFHLAAVDDDAAVVGVASFFPSPTPKRPGADAWQLRGMAVTPPFQGTGVGTLLLDDAVRRLRALGAAVLWADGRDTALGFYKRAGWAVEGDGYVTGIGLPHHTVVLELR
jgi:GNAT superfamily N-acetyltransferase